ncbi:vesicle-associated membrane protein 2 isoform X1 [Cataglyphis hispanica]|uniref:vesicle-associated membrane protein 2 isoform X1 n=1 Tax=Cataglyphis hispanica TaxID=1086592 RepID=UPI0021806B85|nr:vesicle-associated membrane protein 2 isoform X1 [Cataglyphis hispanica]
MATEGGLAPDAAAGAGAGTDSIVGGPRTPQQIASQKRLQATQAQVDEVVDIMKTNVEKVLERDQKLSELDDRADALQQGASQFEQQAGKLKRKFWLQNLKMMIIMGVIGLIVLAIIIVKFMPETPPTPPPYTYQQPGMMPNNMPPGAGNMPAAPAPDAAAAAAKPPPGSGSPKAANAAFVGNLGIGIRSIA